MSQKFQASVQHRGDVSYVKLGGVIDEDNELGELAEKIPNGTAVIDLGEIERINSCGVRDWVNWLSRLETGGTRSVLVECSPAIVAQINLVNNFTGSGVVKSFYVPYFCPECDEEKVLLVETSDMGPPPHEPPTCRCDECDLVMDFDDMPDSYFAFLSNQKKVELDKINGALAGLGRGSDAGANGQPASAPGGKAGTGSSPGNKPKSRASQPGLAGAAKPSVPSLPSIQRTSTVPAAGPGGSSPGAVAAAAAAVAQKAGSRQNLLDAAGKPPSRPNMGSAPGLNKGNSRPPGAMTNGAAGMSMSGNFGIAGANATQPPKSNALVFVLIAILLAAIGVLAYLVLTK